MNLCSKMLVGPAGATLASLFIAALALRLPALAHDHVLHGAVAASAMPVETGAAFYEEMARVNTRMHEAMEVAPTGNLDCDFMRMMIPHHQGAVDMAQVLLKYGRDKRLQRLAQSIIVEQAQEITYMQTLLGAPPEEGASQQRCQ